MGGAWLLLVASLFTLRWWVVAAAAVFLLALNLLFRLARRSGYVTFIPQENAPLPDPITPLKKEERTAVLATGIFSLPDREAYLVQKKSEIWRVGVGDHVLMVERRPNSYLYQFIEPRRILQISAGHLHFGNDSQPAIEVVFHTTWSPKVTAEDIGYYVGSGYASQPLPRHTTYITCHTAEDLHRIWYSLTKQI